MPSSCSDFHKVSWFCAIIHQANQSDFHSVLSETKQDYPFVTFIGMKINNVLLFVNHLILEGGFEFDFSLYTFCFPVIGSSTSNLWYLEFNWMILPISALYAYVIIIYEQICYVLFYLESIDCKVFYK